jgi:hypothetical protein
MPRPIDLISPPDWALEPTASGTKVTRRSIFTQKLNTWELPVEMSRVEGWLHGGSLVQNAFPDLGADQREFLMSGATPEEWDNIFGKGE